MNVDGKGDSADTIVETSAIFQVIIADRVTPMNASAFASSDLFPGRENLDSLPRAAFLRSALIMA